MHLKKLLFIYNPYSGHRNITNRLDSVIEFLSAHSFIVIPNRLDFDKHDELIHLMKTEKLEYIVVAGGDGTINYIVNLMLQNNVDIPLGLIPGGTCNDLSRCLKLPLDLKSALERIVDGKVISIDSGFINKKHYFLSSCAGGVLVDVSFNTSIDLKKTIGPLAYYVKALTELPLIKGYELKIKTDDVYIKDKFYLFLILNGEYAAGFNKLLKSADIRDGYMDLILLKECPHIDLAGLFLNAMKNDLLKDKNVIHIRAKSCKIEGKKGMPITVDGEKHHSLPLDIEFQMRNLRVII